MARPDRPPYGRRAAAARTRTPTVLDLPPTCSPHVPALVPIRRAWRDLRREYADEDAGMPELARPVRAVDFGDAGAGAAGRHPRPARREGDGPREAGRPG